MKSWNSVQHLLRQQFSTKSYFRDAHTDFQLHWRLARGRINFRVVQPNTVKSYVSSRWGLENSSHQCMMHNHGLGSGIGQKSVLIFAATPASGFCPTTPMLLMMDFVWVIQTSTSRQLRWACWGAQAAVVSICVRVIRLVFDS